MVVRTLLVVALIMIVAAESVPRLAGAESEQDRLIAWGEGRFEAAGLTPPDPQYDFRADTEECGWHRGLYDPAAHEVILCTLSEEAMLHELAHAWVEEHVDHHTRAAFMARRGLETWSGHHHAWDRRGTEHAAEIVAWGISESDRTVVWVGDGGRRTRRLLTIEDSDPVRLRAEYRRLTELDPVLRDEASGYPVHRSDLSPEKARIGRGAATTTG